MKPGDDDKLFDELGFEEQPVEELSSEGNDGPNDEFFNMKDNEGGRWVNDVVEYPTKGFFPNRSVAFRQRKSAVVSCCPYAFLDI